MSCKVVRGHTEISVHKGQNWRDRSGPLGRNCKRAAEPTIPTSRTRSYTIIVVSAKNSSTFKSSLRGESCALSPHIPDGLDNFINVISDFVLPKTEAHLIHPLILGDPESVVEEGVLVEQFGEFFDERAQSLFGHVGDEFVEQAALTE